MVYAGNSQNYPLISIFLIKKYWNSLNKNPWLTTLVPTPSIHRGTPPPEKKNRVNIIFFKKKPLYTWPRHSYIYTKILQCKCDLKAVILWFFLLFSYDTTYIHTYRSCNLEVSKSISSPTIYQKEEKNNNYCYFLQYAHLLSREDEKNLGQLNNSHKYRVRECNSLPPP